MLLFKTPQTTICGYIGLVRISLCVDVCCPNQSSHLPILPKRPLPPPPPIQYRGKGKRFLYSMYKLNIKKKKRGKIHLHRKYGLFRPLLRITVGLLQKISKCNASKLLRPNTGCEVEERNKREKNKLTVFILFHWIDESQARKISAAYCRVMLFSNYV
jgi:hypothetical protein